MPFSYYYDANLRTVRISTFGRLTIEEILNYFREVSEDESVPEGAVEIVDVSAVEHFDVDHKEVTTMPSEYESARAQKAFLATLIYGSNKVNSGLVQLIRYNFKKSMPEHDFRVVATEKEALKLLDDIFQ